VTEQDPGDEVAWSAVADLNLKLGHYDEADNAVRRMIAIAPDNPNAYYLLGESHLFRGKYEEAAGEYRKALQADPGFGDAILRIADIEVLGNRPQAAVAQLEPMLASGKFAPSLRITAAFNLAALLRAQGRCPEALAALDRVHADIAAEQVRQALELSTRSRCLLDLHDVARALQLASASVEQSPGNSARYLLARGLAEIQGGRCRGGDRDHRCDSRPRSVQRHRPHRIQSRGLPAGSPALAAGGCRGSGHLAARSGGEGRLRVRRLRACARRSIGKTRELARCTHVRAPGDPARGLIRSQARPRTRAPRCRPAVGATGRLMAPITSESE
jgi:predicted negative regulator of RcsB-dependent stress response